MIHYRQPLRTLVALGIAGTVLAAAWFAGTHVSLPEACFFPSSFIIHLIMVLGTLATARLIDRNGPVFFGFTWGQYRFHPSILLWVLPTALLSTLGVLSGAQDSSIPIIRDMTIPQLIAFVWIWASVSEELLTRGLLQSLLYPSGQVTVACRWYRSFPVIVSGLFFGAMHVVLIRSMGPRAVPIIIITTILGFITARYRERFASLVPAIIIHALFNIGGMLPMWIARWIG
ncbi:CPBP family intramembrane metalloprotease [bacterium]|nr:CPBP family intramembrane metalloprotease [candidate division CSSED10-310 bacterium]